MKCPQCQTNNSPDAAFCQRCGFSFQHAHAKVNLPRKNKGNLTLVLIVLGCLLATCVLGGIVGGVMNAINPTEVPKESTTEKRIREQREADTQLTLTPTPTPLPPPTFEQMKTSANNLLKLDQEEYSKQDIAPFTNLSEQLGAMPKTAKEYKEAQSVKKKLDDRVIRLAAERLVLGDKPTSGYGGKVYEVDSYLSKTLNDYDDSEYLEWTPVRKMEVRGEPYWVVGLKLRAKNGFGAKMVKDVIFFIRDGQVVKTTGL